MVFSRVDGKPSADLTKLSGHAYMSGADSWVDLERMLGEYCAIHHVGWFGVCQTVFSVRSYFCFFGCSVWHFCDPPLQPYFVRANGAAIVSAKRSAI